MTVTMGDSRRSSVPGAGGSVEDGVAIASAYREAGVAYVCSSSGGNSPLQKVPVGPGYQVPFAEKIRNEADIPTIAEQGFPNFEASSFVALLGPAGLPRDIVQTLNGELAAILRDPETRAGLLLSAHRPWEVEAWADIVREKARTMPEAAFGLSFASFFETTSVLE